MKSGKFMKISEIIEIIENIAPPEIAEEWDNVGLLLGDKDKNVSKVLVALDINAEIIKQAVENKVDLIVTHHPLIFKPIGRVTDKNLLVLLENKIAVYSAHTNLDNCEDGVNKVLAELLELENIKREGMSAYGDCNECDSLQFIELVKTKLGVNSVRCSNVTDKKIKKVAVLGGSGGDFLMNAVNLGCDAFITGEASYHDAQCACENNILLITAGHFETENPVVDMLCELLQSNTEIVVIKAKPFNVYITK